MALQGVGPNTSRRLSELNNDIFIHTLCDERATIDKHRIIADFNKLIKPIFSSYASKVFSPLARPTTDPYGIFLDPLKFAESESELYATIAPQLLISPAVWRDAASRIQSMTLILIALEPLMRAWAGLVRRNMVPTELEPDFFDTHTLDDTAAQPTSITDDLVSLEPIYEYLTPTVTNDLVPLLAQYVSSAKVKMIAAQARLWHQLTQEGLAYLANNHIVSFSGMGGSPVAITIPNKSQIGLVGAGAGGATAQECLIYFWRDGVYSRHVGMINPFQEEPNELDVDTIRRMETPANFVDVTALRFPVAAGLSLGAIPPGALFGGGGSAGGGAAAGGVGAFDSGLPEAFWSDSVCPGYLSRASVYITRKFQAVASVPVWDHDNTPYGSAVARSLSNLRFPDLGDHDEGSSLSATLKWLDQVWERLRVAANTKFLLKNKTNGPISPP